MEKGDYIVAIDLGSNAVAVVAGVQTEEGAIRVVDCEIAPVLGMSRSEVKNVEEVSQSIKEALEALEKRLGVQITSVYAGVSGQHIRCVKSHYYVYVGGDGEIRDEDLKKLHENMSNVPAPEGEKIIHITPQSYMVDGEETPNPIGTFGTKLEAVFNVILGDHTAISRVKRALSRVPVQVSRIFANVVSSAESVTCEDEREEGVAVVDMGGATTEVSLFYKGALRHIAIIPLGGNAINKDICAYGILPRHVENLKLSHGEALSSEAPMDKSITTPGLTPRSTKKITAQDLSCIIEARVLDIVDYVMAEIKSSGYADQLTGGIVLCGGCAQLKNIDRLIGDYTQIDVRIATSDVNLTEDSIEKVASPEYATAVGLLLKGVAMAQQRRGARTSAVGSAITPTSGVGRSLYGEGGSTQGFTSGEPLSSRTIHQVYGDEPEDDFAAQEELEDDYTPEEPQERKPKGSFFKWAKRAADKLFDASTIEDNNI